MQTQSDKIHTESESLSLSLSLPALDSSTLLFSADERGDFLGVPLGRPRSASEPCLTKSLRLFCASELRIGSVLGTASFSSAAADAAEDAVTKPALVSSCRSLALYDFGKKKRKMGRS